MLNWRAGQQRGWVYFCCQLRDTQIIISDSVPYPVGVVLRRRASTVMPVSGVYLLLRKDQRMPDGYRIHTGYAE
ncbi:RNase A-like domain-containing protein [Pseudomonas lini]|uniref:RNase A-like domain-containing protein n=1 Tax=Pseudomonas lini TaxID=163011 RepID=UPI003610CFED